jgi:ribokinase
VRCAVIGHAEWVEFARVPQVPVAGEIVHATDIWSEPAGGGPVVASQLAKLAGGCDFFTALGDDELGHAMSDELQRLELDVHVITVLGDKLLPDAPAGIDAYDLVFFVAGSVAALRAARGARFLAATLRELPTLRRGAVAFDLLVGSAADPGERYDSSLEARTVVLTEGEAGGVANGRRYSATTLPAAVVDSYGAGDSFAAALAFGLADGAALNDALDLAARAGAAVLAGRGPYVGQLALPS